MLPIVAVVTVDDPDWIQHNDIYKLRYRDIARDIAHVVQWRTGIPVDY